jgi:microcystin-dependent protein
MFNSRNNIGIIMSLIRKNGINSYNNDGNIHFGLDAHSNLVFDENSVFAGPITGISTLHISGNTTLRGPITGLSTLNISGNTTLQGPITGVSSLNISGNTTLQGPITGLSTLNISGNITANSDLTILGSLNSRYVKQEHVPIGTYSLLVPTGSVTVFAGAVAPGGWLFCDGSTVARAVYEALYNVIGTTYGGNSTNFNLPDMRGRVAIGVGAGAGLTNRILGVPGGSETHTLTTSELPAHTHTGTTDATTVSLNDATSVVRAPGGGDNIDISGGGGISGGNAVSNITADSHTHTFTTNSTGGGNAHTIMQPYLPLYYIIKY